MTIVIEQEPSDYFQFHKILQEQEQLKNKNCLGCFSDECYRCSVHEEWIKLQNEYKQQYRKIGLVQSKKVKLIKP